MHPALKKSATVVAAAAVVALAANGVSYATTGQTIVAGQWNKTDSTTTIHDTSPGPALRLISKGTDEPSLKVSSTARVPHLNASMLQGRYATDLANHATVFTAGGRNPVFTGDVAYGVDIAPGVYDVSFSAVIGPSEGDPANPTPLECGVFPASGPGLYAIASALYVGTVPPMMSADNVVRVHPGGTVMACYSDSTSAQFLVPFKASFVKMNSMTKVHAGPPLQKTKQLPAFTR